MYVLVKVAGLKKQIIVFQKRIVSESSLQKMNKKYGKKRRLNMFCCPQSAISFIDNMITIDAAFYLGVIFFDMAIIGNQFNFEIY
jgi:hypothetical protein